MKAIVNISERKQSCCLLFSIMLLGYVLLQVMCAAMCVGSSLPNSEESRHIRFPYPQKVLNSVLERLERSRQERFETDTLTESLNCNDPSEILPEYTELIENVNARDRSLRQLTSQKHLPICLLERKIRKLNTNEYEYRPAYYEEVNCVPGYSNTNEICTSLGFSCVQWNKTIHLTRRRYTSECWETKTMVIPAGCECMWPAHNLGDMKLHK